MFGAKSFTDRLTVCACGGLPTKAVAISLIMIYGVSLQSGCRAESSAGTATYQHGSLSFQYPANWNIQERQGPRAFSVQVFPGESATAFFYIGIRDVAPGTDGAVQHELDLRQLMNVDPNWTRIKGPVADNHIPGRTAYQSVLRKSDGLTSQLVSSMVKDGKLVVISYTFERNTTVSPNVFTLVSDSLTF